MGFFTYGAKQATSVDELSVIQKIQIVTHLNHVHVGPLTRKEQKKFNCSKPVLESLQNSTVHTYIDEQSIPEHLRAQDAVFHPHLEEDFHPCDVGPNQEWDSVHYGIHLTWSESNCIKLLVGLFEDAMNSLKQSTLQSKRDTYNESLEYIKSDLNKVLFNYLGLDHEDFCEQVPNYKERYDTYVSTRSFTPKGEILEETQLDPENIDDEWLDFFIVDHA